MTKAEHTRQFIIEQTAPLFNMKGFEGTSLADLTHATGLTKGSLYGNFQDKEEMAVEAFRYSISKVKSLCKNKVETGRTYKKKLLLLLDVFASYVLNPPVRGGCPLLNNAVEADDHHTSMRKIVTEELNSTVLYISTLIKKGIANREFKTDTKVKDIAYAFFCSVEGGIMMSRVSKSQEPMNAVVRHCKHILNQISK